MAVDPKKQTYYSNNRSRAIGDLTRLAKQLSDKGHDPIIFIDVLFECLAAAKPVTAFDGQAAIDCLRPMWDSEDGARIAIIKDRALARVAELEAKLAALEAVQAAPSPELLPVTSRGRAKA
jgi:hypothetical protein